MYAASDDVKAATVYTEWPNTAVGLAELSATTVYLTMRWDGRT